MSGEFLGKRQDDRQILSVPSFEVTNASLKKLGSLRGVKAGSVLMVNRPMNKSEGRINRMGADVPDQAERSGAGRVLW